MKKEISLLAIGLALGSIVTFYAFDKEWGSSPSLSESSASPKEEPPLETPIIDRSEEVEALKRQVAELQARLTPLEKRERGKKEKERYLAFTLKKYDALFELSPEQRELIGELEWESKQFWGAVFAKKGKQKVDNYPNLKREVAKVLTPEQNEIYQKHLKQSERRSAEMAATAYLSRIPVTLEISDEQRDRIYATVYTALHRDTAEAYGKENPHPKDSPYSKMDYTVIRAAEGVLSEEQLLFLKGRLLKAD